MDESMFTVTGVIATVLSLIFATAAIWNSYSRRKIMQAESTPSPDELQIKFTPMETTPAAPPANPPAVTPPPAVPPPKPASNAVFHQVRPGSVHPGRPLADDHDNLYVWE